MAAEQFEVGEIALYFRPGHERHLEEVLLLEYLADGCISDISYQGPIWLFRRSSDNAIVGLREKRLGVPPYMLRKKRLPPPALDFTVGDWDLLPPQARPRTSTAK